MSGRSDDDLARTATAADASAAPTSSPSIETAELGRTLGRYRLERRLGEGGMGVVHAAFDPDLERRVALKVLRDARGSEEARQRLLREARAMARLTHPNVVTVHEVGSAGGRDYVAMELVEGETLADWLRAAPRSPDDVLDAFRAAGRGLAAAHAAGLVHRDFKPHNVLRRPDGRVCVTDFGLARGVETTATGLEVTLDSASASASSTTTPSSLSGLTATGSVLGTPAYMAPEQWAGGVVGPPADQFAYCVALWEALSGERPFRGATLDDLKAEVSRGPQALDTTKLPKELRAALMRGLDPDPAKRWPSMDALLDAIAPPREPSRTRWPLYAVGGAVIAAAGIYVALGRGASTPVASCDAVDGAVAAVWPAGTGDALAAAGRADLRDMFEHELASWRAVHTKACALPPEHRAAALTCLDGALARLDTLHRAADKISGELPMDIVLAQVFEPAACTLPVPPRVTVAANPDTIAAVALALDAWREDTKVTAEQLAHAGNDPCGRALALMAQVVVEKEMPKKHADASELINATEVCGDDRLRAEAAIETAPLAFERPTIGPRGRAAIEKAKIASDRVAQTDLSAKVDLQLAQVAAQDGKWDEAFAATARALETFGARGRVRAQFRALETEIGLRFRRNGRGDLEAVRAAVARWRPTAVAAHLQDIVDELDGGDAYARLFLGDAAGAHATILRLWKPTTQPAANTMAIEGDVVDPAGKPVAGAVVGAAAAVFVDAIGPFPFGDADSTQFRMATTDAHGHFALPEAARQGAVVARVGDLLAAVPIAPRVHLALAATRTVSGKVDLGSLPSSQVFVLASADRRLGAMMMTPLAHDGTFELSGAPTAELHVGVARWGSAMSSDVQFTTVPAGKTAVTGLALATPSSSRRLVVVARSAVALPLDGAQVFIFAGHVQMKTWADLDALPKHDSMQTRLARPIVGEAVPPEAAGKTRAGDLIAEFSDAHVGELSACVVGMHGDMNDPETLRRLQAHQQELVVHCEPVAPGDHVVVVEAPPQKRFD